MTDPFSNALTAAEANLSAVQAADTAATTLEAQLAAANAQVTSDQATISGLTGQVSSLTATVNADVATITALQAQIAALQGKTTPTTLWGIDASDAAEHAMAVSNLGNANIDFFRYYHQPNEPMTYPTEYALTAGQGFVYSAKVHPQNITLAMLVSLFSSVPAGVVFYWTPWHEPEDDVAAGTFTSAQLKAVYPLARQAQQQVGNPNIKITPILMGYTWNPASGRKVSDYLPDNPANMDALGADCYVDGTIGGTSVSTMFDAPAATAASLGKPLIIPETGVGQSVSGAARDAALTLLAQTAQTKGVALVCYFWGSSDSNQWELLTSDGSLPAWVAAISAN